MTNKDKGQFLAEIKFIGLQKEFKGLFGEKLKPINLIKKVDNILDTRRTAYNYAFVKCCEKNKIDNIDNVYTELDKLWNKSRKEIDLIIDGSSLLLNWFGGIFGVFGKNAIGIYQSRISEHWEKYINETIVFAQEIDNLE